jgi:hypothetical protein
VSRLLALSQTGLLPSGHWIPSAFRPVARGSIEGYTSVAFDLFMQKGKDAEFYAAPYRYFAEFPHIRGSRL